MTAVNHQYRDRLFHFLFGREERKGWTLDLYNAINNSNYPDPSSVQITTIEEALYLSMRNGVSFLIDNVMNLYEQQSTFNPNMPLRGLQYVSSLFEKYIEERKLNKYSTRRILLPIPKLVVLYNGTRKIDDEQLLRLSDMFPPDSDPDVDVRCRMLNICYGHNRELLDRCRPLNEYSWLIDRIGKYREKSSVEEAVERAIRDMPENFLLKPLLNAHKAEVQGMLLTEYDEEKQRALDHKDGYEEGIEQGRAEGHAEGRKEGILLLIDTLRDLGLEEQAILDKVAAKCSLSPEEAAQYSKG